MASERKVIQGEDIIIVIDGKPTLHATTHSLKVDLELKELRTKNTNGRPHLPATSALLFLGRYYFKLQKAFERLFPLCHQSLCMYENQGVRFSLPDYIRGNDSLTERRCCR